MNYIIIDLEWNQCPNGKAKEEKMLPFEIIEIGAVKVNESRKMIGEFHEIIKPAVYTVLNDTFKEIVPGEMEELKQGRKFPDVIREFFEWCGEEYRFATWGPMDLVELQRNMKYYQLSTLSHKPFFYYDVQRLFAVFFEENKQARTLAFAVEFFHIEEKEEFHSAIADAKYTALIFQKFDLKKTKKYMEIDYFNAPKKREDEMYVSFTSYSKYISMEYKTKELLLGAKNVKSAVCCICQGHASKKIDWFSNNNRNYYGVFLCKQHGYLKGKLRVKKSEDERYFAVKTIKIISKDEATSLKKQKEEIHLKKMEKKNGIQIEKSGCCKQPLRL